MDDLTLAAEFPAAARDQWLALVERVLKGADFETLVARTRDGIRIEPLYAKAEGHDRLVLPLHGRWRIAQRVDHPDPDTANGLALADLEGGADALTLVFPEAAGARGFGLAAQGLDDLDRALRHVKLDLVHLRLEAGSAGFRAAAHIPALAERRGHALADLDLDLGLDPIGALAASGRLPESWPAVAARCTHTLSSLTARSFKGRAFLADGRPYHEAGAAEAQELAAVLATGLAYLRAIEDGRSLDAARDALSFLLVADADQFLTVAKLRALRRLRACVEQACGLVPKPVRLHAETAWRMTTRRDPWVNLLRGTMAAFSAGIGGADSVSVLPFTAALGLPDAFARRLARNSQLILQEEANLWRVADPVAGAGGFEALTDGLCGRAWELFQEIERGGGLVASLEAGVLQARISEVRTARDRAVATGAQPITGTSAFPNLDEADVKVLLPSPFAREAESRSDRELEPAATVVTPLPSMRDAEPFERLRDAADAILARIGARPTVFLATLGAPADIAEQAGFAKTLFESGGIAAVGSDGLTSAETAAEIFAASGARLACLCASHRVEAGLVVSVAAALRRAGARALYVAEKPERLQEHLRGAGVMSYIFPGCDAVAILGEALAAAAA